MIKCLLLLGQRMLQDSEWKNLSSFRLGALDNGVCWGLDRLCWRRSSHCTQPLFGCCYEELAQMEEFGLWESKTFFPGGDAGKGRGTSLSTVAGNAPAGRATQAWGSCSIPASLQHLVSVFCCFFFFFSPLGAGCYFDMTLTAQTDATSTRYVVSPVLPMNLFSATASEQGFLRQQLRNKAV